MFKTVLKVLIFYIILSAMVSVCSLMGEYAGGFGDATSEKVLSRVETTYTEGTGGTTSKGVPASTTNDLTQKLDYAITNKVFTKIENQKIKECNGYAKMGSLDITFSINKRVCKELLDKNNNANYVTLYYTIIALDKDLPKDLIQMAFAELKKRKKFSPVEDMRGITLFSLIDENETYFDVDEST